MLDINTDVLRADWMHEKGKSHQPVKPPNSISPNPSGPSIKQLKSLEIPRLLLIK